MATPNNELYPKRQLHQVQQSYMIIVEPANTEHLENCKKITRNKKNYLE
jgi:hypothetical protein